MSTERDITALCMLAGLLFGSLLLAFFLRRWFGLAPLLMTFGVNEAIKHFVAMPMRADFLGLGEIGVGSAVFFTASLAIALVLYVKEGIKAVMPVAWSLAIVALTCAFITACLAVLSNDAIAQSALLSIAPIWNLLVGSTLLFFDIAVLVLVHGLVMQRGKYPFLAMSVAILVVVCIDTLIYNLLTRPHDAVAAQLLVDIAAKSFFGVFYALMAWGYFRWIDYQTQDSDTNPYTRLADFFSVFDLQRRVSQLEKLAHEDPLTGAYNRRYLERSYAQLRELDQQRGLQTGLMLLDIDHFKQFNDHYGHTLGDCVLQHVVRRMQAQARRSDCVCRIGGEEFVYVMNAVTWPELLAKANALCRDIAQTPLSHKAADLQDIKITLTAGAALSGEDGETLSELLAAADKRMYEGKRTGRNRVIGKGLRLT
jgi:diguanylate cyclase (GGDEF)-like protein